MPTSNSDRRTFESILEEILTLRDEGKPVDVATYVARFPEHAADLRRYVEGSALVDVAIDEEKRALQSFGLGRWFPGVGIFLSTGGAVAGGPIFCSLLLPDSPI